MKKLILALTILAFAGARVQTASAGDREWATAGKILTDRARLSKRTGARSTADNAPGQTRLPWQRGGLL